MGPLVQHQLSNKIIIITKIKNNTSKKMLLYTKVINFTDVEKERSLLANVPPNMYESNVCLPELSDYIPPPAHHYNNNNNNTGKS